MEELLFNKTLDGEALVNDILNTDSVSSITDDNGKSYWWNTIDKTKKYQVKKYEYERALQPYPVISYKIKEIEDKVMKANEAPEKIYIDKEGIADEYWLYDRNSEEDVEYTRTDALMTQEEKAKAYDRALGIAKAWYKLDNNDLCNDDLKTHFPELKESEDERAKKD